MTTSPPTSLELARELRALCRNFEPSFRLIGNMRGDDIERVAVAVLDLAAQLAASQREADRLRHGVPVEGDLVCPAEVEAVELRATVARLTGEREALRRDGRALVKQFENVSEALNDIGWPSQNALGTERACDALRTLHCSRKAIKTQRDRLRSALVEARDIAEHLADLRKAEHTAALVKIDELRLAADGSE